MATLTIKRANIVVVLSPSTGAVTVRRDEKKLVVTVTR